MPAQVAGRTRIRLALTIALLIVVLCGTTSGCRLVARAGSDPRGAECGKTFYVGGAGPFGPVGTTSVPRGLRKGGYDGAIEVFGWQSVLGGTLRDQVDVARNKKEAARLANKIRAYLDEYPDRPVCLIGLSAGTGIIAWAVDSLPDNYRINHVVFLGSSLSRDYDLSGVLERLDGQLWNFYSTSDPILRSFVPLTGSVDREFDGGGVAGLYGLVVPTGVYKESHALYAARLRNMPWRRAYGRLGYRGWHTDSVATRFVARIITPLLRRHSAPAPAPGTTSPIAPAVETDAEDTPGA